MSHHQAHWNFTFGAGNNDHVASKMPPASTPAGTMNPVDLHTTWADPFPAQQPLYGYAAAPQPENIRDPIPQNAAGIFTAAPQANPPANFPAWQGAVLTPAQQPLHHNIAVQQPEMAFRSWMPTNSANFFLVAPHGPASTIPAPQPAVVSGVGARLGRADPAEEARMVAEGKLLKEARKLGPRRAKWGAAEALEAEPAEPPAKNTRRPGPVKAPEGVVGWRRAFNDHKSDCPEGQECLDTCPVKVYWPEKWAKKKRSFEVTADDTGDRVLTNGLWMHLFTAGDGYKGKGRPKARSQQEQQ